MKEARIYTDEDVYKITYHYIHYLPGNICVMLVPSCLYDRTRQALAKDLSILIDSITLLKEED